MTPYISALWRVVVVRRPYYVGTASTGRNKSSRCHHPNRLSVLHQSPIMTTNSASPGPVTNTGNDSIGNDTRLEIA